MIEVAQIFLPRPAIRSPEARLTIHFFDAFMAELNELMPPPTNLRLQFRKHSIGPGYCRYWATRHDQRMARLTTR